MDDVYLTMKGAKVVANLLIEDGSCKSVDLAMYALYEINNWSFKKTLITLCSMCAGKIGL